MKILLEKWGSWSKRGEVQRLVLLLGIAGLLYFSTAPISVQSGDTGELVTNAYLLRVTHPPGYPLWNLLYHVPVRYFGDNPFFSAAIFSVVISLISLGRLFWCFRTVTALAVVSVLASVGVVWRYAIFPDVFALHLLFLALLFTGFLRPDLLLKPTFLMLLSLSVANHHTIVLVFPLFAFAFYRVINLRLFCLSIFFGTLSLCLYFSLLAFRPQDYGSWGSLKDVGDVLDHFLRTDYGTFRLKISEGGSNSWVWFFLERLVNEGWALVLTLGFLIIRYWPHLVVERVRLGVLGSTFFIYFWVFEVFGKVSLDLEGEGIFERFLLQPLFLFTFILLFFAHRPGVRLPKLLTIALFINAGVNVVKNFQANDYRRNTVIEDYILNGLRSLPKNAVAVTSGDTLGFGTYYVREVLGIRRDVIQIHSSFGFRWSKEKFFAQFPDVYLDHPNLRQKIINPKYRLFSTQVTGPVAPNHAISFYGLWLELVPDDPKTFRPYRCEVTRNFRFRRRPSLSNFRSFDVSNYLDNTFGNCDFNNGVAFLAAGDLAGARLALERSLEISPFHVRAQERLCFVYRQLALLEATECEARLDELLTNMDRQYVLGKY